MTAIEAPSLLGAWQLDPVHSSVAFEVPYLIGTFKGQFRDVQAALTIEPEGARIEGAAEVASVDVKDENLAAHLQSPDFFDAERHPQLRFEAAGVELGSGPLAFEGTLTIKGVTRTVELAGEAT